MVSHPELIIVGHSNAVTALAFSADGKTLVSRSRDQTAIVWDVETGTMRRILQAGEGGSLVLSPDGSIAATDYGHIWDTRTGRLLRRYRWYDDPMACSPDGKMLASTTFAVDECIRLSDIRTGRTKRLFAGGDRLLGALIFSVDSALVAALCSESQEDKPDQLFPFTTLWNIRTGETQRVLQGKFVYLFTAALTANTRLMAVSDCGKQLLDAETGEVLKTLTGIDPSDIAFGLRVIALSSDANLLAIGTREGRVYIWDVRSDRHLWKAQAHQGRLSTLAFTRDGQILATAGEDHAIRLWDAATGELRCTLGRDRISAKAVAFTADGESISAIGSDGTARLWSIKQARLERQQADLPDLLSWQALQNPVTARHLWTVDASTLPTSAEVPDTFTIASLSRDASLIALRLPGDVISIWNRSTRTIQCTLPDAAEGYADPTFSPDNRLLVMAVSPDSRLVRLFDTQTGNACQEWTIEYEKDSWWPGEAITFAFSPDGGVLAVGHGGFAVTLWNVQTGKQKRVMGTQGDEVCALAFSPDGKTLAIGTSYEETAWLRRLGRGGKEIPLIGHTAAIWSIDYAPDGTQVVTGAEDGAVKLWEASSGKLLATFQTLPSGEWVVYTPEGHYTASPGAVSNLLWRDGTNLLPITASGGAHRL